MLLPTYNLKNIGQRRDDLDAIVNCSDIEALCNFYFNSGTQSVFLIDTVYNFLKSPSFSLGSDYSQTEDFYRNLSNVIHSMFITVKAFGFPYKPTNLSQESKIDLALTKTLIESLEENDFETYPCQVNSALLQEFMTQKVMALIVFWRWKIVTNKNISKERITSSPRNYFYTLWLTGWLFDAKKQYPDQRWELLDYMSADSIVQIIERSGVGLRRGFALAVANERKSRSEILSNSTLDKLVRGCMKRATFTFATTAMLDNDSYYKEICTYLFDWAEEYYLDN